MTRGELLDKYQAWIIHLAAGAEMSLPSTGRPPIPVPLPDPPGHPADEPPGYPPDPPDEP